MALMHLGPFDPTLAETGDYLHTATNPHSVVCGQKAAPFRPAQWTAHVRGTDPDDGAVIGIAWYDVKYDTKARATARARELLAHVKALRAAGVE